MLIQRAEEQEYYDEGEDVEYYDEEEGSKSVRKSVAS